MNWKQLETNDTNKKFKTATKDRFSNPKEVDNFFFIFSALEFGRKVEKKTRKQKDII